MLFWSGKLKNFSWKPVALISILYSTDRFILRKNEKMQESHINTKTSNIWNRIVMAFWIWSDKSPHLWFVVWNISNYNHQTSFSFSCVSWSVNEKQLGQMRELCLKIKDEQSLYSSIQGEGQIGIALQLSQLDLVIWGIINRQVINVTNIYTKIVYIKCGFEVSMICIWGSWMVFLTKDWKNIRSGFEVNRICI